MKIIDYVIVIIYVTLATKILKGQLIYPKNVINEMVYPLSARCILIIHTNLSWSYTTYQSKKINILLLIYVTMATVTKWSATILKSILEDCNIFLVKLYMSTTFSVKMTDICFPDMENKKKENVQ